MTKEEKKEVNATGKQGDTGEQGGQWQRSISRNRRKCGPIMQCHGRGSSLCSCDSWYWDGRGWVGRWRCYRRGGNEKRKGCWDDGMHVGQLWSLRENRGLRQFWNRMLFELDSEKAEVDGCTSWMVTCIVTSLPLMWWDVTFRTRKYSKEAWRGEQGGRWNRKRRGR